MAITTEAGLQAAILNARKVRFLKTFTQSNSGIWHTSFRIAGQPGSGGAAPASTGVTLSRTSAGALPIQPGSGTSYLAEVDAASTAAGTVALADRLVEFGGLVANVTTAQSVSALALPARASSATDVELWLEVYTAVGATPSPVVTASYTNQAGTAGRTATLVGGLGASAPAPRTYQFALQAGDTGVQSVQSLTLGTSTATAGNIGLTLRRTLLTAFVPSIGTPSNQTWAETDLQVIPDDACLEVLYLNGSGNGTIVGSIRIAQG